MPLFFLPWFLIGLFDLTQLPLLHGLVGNWSEPLACIRQLAASFIHFVFRPACCHFMWILPDGLEVCCWRPLAFLEKSMAIRRIFQPESLLLNHYIRVAVLRIILALFFRASALPLFFERSVNHLLDSGELFIKHRINFVFSGPQLAFSDTLRLHGIRIMRTVRFRIACQYRLALPLPAVSSLDRSSSFLP